MLAYILKRLLLVVPTLFLISIIAFYLSRNTPQDEVVSIMNMRGLEAESQNERIYKEVYYDLKLDRPNFYFSIVPRNYPHTLNSYPIAKDRALAKDLLKSSYDHKAVKASFRSFEAEKHALEEEHNSQALLDLEFLKDDADSFSRKYLDDSDKYGFILPSFRWHGLDNQYNLWLEQALFHEFGVSISDGKSALSKVRKALLWTLSFTLIDFIISIAFGLMIGLYLSRDPRNKAQMILRQILYLFYAIPVFWLATMLLIYFTTDDYGSWTNIFPSVGIDIYPGESTLKQIFLNFDKLLLPIICLSLHSLAYVSRMVENGITDELSKDYVLLSYSKGMQKKQVLKREVLKNAMTPSITLFMGALASAFSGSLVLEVIYGIPGMGRLMYNALSIADWNVAFCILMLLSLVTIIAYLIGDVLYAYFNPKVRFNN